MKQDVLGIVLSGGRETLTDKLLRIVDDFDIYAELIGFEPELGECISSPIRASDDFPSFALYIPTRLIAKGYDIRPDEIWFKDLADSRYGDIFKFVKCFAAFTYGEDLQSRYEVIQFIDQQLELGMFDTDGKQREKIARDFSRHKQSKEICIKSRNFTKRDLEYWKEYDIDEEALNHFGVKSVNYLLKDDGEIRRQFRKSELCFFYPMWDKGKLYQPHAEKAFKFRNSCPGDDPYYYQGFNQLEGHDTLIITKSMKDVMVFWKVLNKDMELNVDVIAPHAESIKLSDEFVNAVKERYKRVIVVSDYDRAGVQFAQRCKAQGFEYKFVDTNRILINGKYKVVDKDISDFLFNHGVLKTKKLLNKWKLGY